MNKRLVVHVIHNLECGGAETLLLNICKEVKKKESSVDFRIILLEDLTYLADDFNTAGIPFEVLPLKSKNIFQWIYILTKRLKELKPLVIHSHLPSSDIIAPISGFLAGVKYRYTTIHSMFPTPHLYYIIARIFTTLFATKIIAVSNSSKIYSVKNNLYPFRKISVIYNAPGFKPSQPPRAKVLSGKNTLINVGRLHLEKGQIHLIRAIRNLADKGIDCTLKILGDGDQRHYFESEIVKLNLKTHVELIGITNNVENYLYDADSFVASSLSEGLPLAQLEGLMLGLPLIATSIPTHREILSKDNKKSKIHLCKSDNEESLVEAISNAISLTTSEYHDESLRALRIAEHFSLDNMVDQYTKIYTI